MKYFVLPFIILLSISCRKKNTKKETQVIESEIGVVKESNVYKNCEDAKKNAFKDFGKGKFICKNIDYINFVSLDDNFESFFETILYSKYSIIIDHHSYLTSSKDRCYTKTMDSLLFVKYENNVYAKTREYAKDVYNISELEKSKLLDLNKAYSETLESFPKFIGNDKIISDYLTKKINNPKEYKSAGLMINTEGIIYDITLDEGIEYNKPKMIEDLNSFGKFVSGYLFGIKVNSRTWFYYY